MTPDRLISRKLLAFASLLFAVGYLNIEVSRFAAAQETPPAATANVSTPFRKLAPGVETVVPAEIKPDETFTIETVLETPNTRVAQSVQCLEFTFKPLRFIRVRLPTETGGTEERLVWYLVYHVKQPVVDVTDAKGEPIPPQAMRFYPNFWLEDAQTKRVYQDRLIPAAIPVIQRLREDQHRKLLSVIDIEGEIPPSPAGEDHSFWGVATWDNVDLRINRFAIYVTGLSTSFKIGTEPGQEGQRLQKTLQINFWRPGDAFHEREDEIRLGTPGDVDYRWLYR